LSGDDTPHVFLTGFTWEVPGPSSAGLSQTLLGGWHVGGTLRYESGRPLNIFMNNDLGGLLFNGQKRPNRVSGTDGVAASGDFDPATDNYFDRNAWVDPGPLQFGNAPKVDGSVRSFPNYSEDVNVFKEFRLREAMKLRFEMDIGNLFNRVIFCDPNTNWSSPAFGTVNTQCNQARSVQFAIRLDY
jgi:hypothetical protein